MILLVPIRTKNGLNQRTHWAVRAKQVKAERKATALAWYYQHGTKRTPTVTLPCVVTLTRIAPRELDGDNLQGSLKGCRDEIAALMGVDDRDARVTWAYGQERGRAKEYGVRVEIESAAKQGREGTQQPRHATQPADPSRGTIGTIRPAGEAPARSDTGSEG